MHEPVPAGLPLPTAPACPVQSCLQFFWSSPSPRLISVGSNDDLWQSRSALFARRLRSSRTSRVPLTSPFSDASPDHQQKAIFYSYHLITRKLDFNGFRLQYWKPRAPISGHFFRTDLKEVSNFSLIAIFRECHKKCCSDSLLPPPPQSRQPLEPEGPR